MVQKYVIIHTKQTKKKGITASTSSYSNTQLKIKIHTAAAVFQILGLYPQIQFQQLPLWVRIQQLNFPYQKLAQNQCQMRWLLSNSSTEHQLTTTKQTNKSQKYNNASSYPVNISKTFLNLNSLQI